MAEDSEALIGFDPTPVYEIIERVKKANDYDAKDLNGKLALKAGVEVEVLSAVMQCVQRVFAELPAYDPAFQGQQIREVLEALFPDSADIMQLRWLPYLLSPKTVYEFPVIVESGKYVLLRETAHRLLNTEDDKLSEEERAHLTDICDGRMPPGVYSSHHSAWLLCDPLHDNTPLNRASVDSFLEEQELPKGSRPKDAEQLKREIAEKHALKEQKRGSEQ